MFNPTVVKEFHPLYADIMDLGFEMYFMQQFIGKGKKIEIYLEHDLVYKPENGGYFTNEKEYVRGTIKREINPDKMILHLAYIGIDEELRKKGEGTNLLYDICYLADKYNFQIELDINTQFGTPYEVLKSWYEQFGFQYIWNNKMIRFRESLRYSVKKYTFPEKYLPVIDYVCDVYEEAAKDEGYEKEARNDFILSKERAIELSQKHFLNYTEMYLLTGDIEGVDGLLLHAEENPLFDECVQCLKELIKEEM